MAQSTEVQLVIQAVDKATSALVNVNKSMESVGKTATEANKKAAEGAKQSSTELLTLNAVLELTKKGFELLKFSIEVPLEQFHALFEASSALVRKYDEQYLSELKLVTAAKASGNASSDNVAQFKDLAEELERTTRFQSEAIESGQAMALSMGANAKIIPKLTQAALDLATATGEDATGGFVKLIQAVETGTLRTFGRAHIEIQRTGDAMTDFATAAAAAERVAGQGIAQLAGQGGAGPLIIMEKALESVEKRLGAVIAQSPQFKGFVETVTQVLEELGQFIQQHGPELGNLFGATFTASLNVAVQAVKLFIATLQVAASLIFKMLDALSHVPGLGIDSPFKAINNQIDRLKDELTDRASLTNTANSWIEDALGLSTNPGGNERIIKFLSEEIDRLNQKKKDLAENPLASSGLVGSLDVLTASASKLGDEIAKNPLFSPNGFMDRWAENTKKHFDDVKGSAEQFAERAQPDFAGVEKALRSYLESVEAAKGQTDDFNKSIANMRVSQSVGFFDDLVKASAASGTQIEAATHALDFLAKQGDITQEELDKLTKQLSAGMDKSSDKIDEANKSLKALKDTATSFPGTTPGVPAAPAAPSGGGSTPASSPAAAPSSGGLFSGLNQAAKAMSDAVISAADKFAEQVAKFAEPVTTLTTVVAAMSITNQATMDAATSMLNAGDVMAQVGAFLMAAGSVQESFAKTSANHMISAANDLVTASGFLDKSNRHGSFPALAVGGVAARGPFTATIGEVPEVVLPLDDRGLDFARSLVGGSGGGGSAITVNVHVDSLELSDRSMADVAKLVERGIADRLLETARRR